MRSVTPWIAALIIFGLVPAASATADAGPEAAEQVIRETTTEVLNRLAGQREALQQEPARLYGLIEEVVLPHFDFEAMSRLVLGRYWRSASEAQRSRFTEEFRGLLVRTYGTALLEYTGQEIRYRPVHAEEDLRRLRVPTEVVPEGGGPPIPIVYRLYDTEGQWKVYDITVDGVSLLLNYRNSYSQVVRREGLDVLIQRMAEKNSGAGGA